MPKMLCNNINPNFHELRSGARRLQMCLKHGSRTVRGASSSTANKSPKKCHAIHFKPPPPEKGSAETSGNLIIRPMADLIRETIFCFECTRRRQGTNYLKLQAHDKQQMQRHHVSLQLLTTKWMGSFKNAAIPRLFRCLDGSSDRLLAKTTAKTEKKKKPF